MGRIDVQTLVLAFEKRINALEKNPPDKVPTSVIINMLEKSIDDIIKDHFMVVTKVEIEKKIKNEFKGMHEKFITKVIKKILSDDSFRLALEKHLTKQILKAIGRDKYMEY